MVPDGRLAHFDLHTDNVLALDDGTVTGIIDWEGACAGDHRHDLVAYAFDLDGHGQQIWDRVEPLVEPHMLRAYVEHMALRRTDWAIRHHPRTYPGSWTAPSACSTATAPRLALAVELSRRACGSSGGRRAGLGA